MCFISTCYEYIDIGGGLSSTKGWIRGVDSDLWKSHRMNSVSGRENLFKQVETCVSEGGKLSFDAKSSLIVGILQLLGFGCLHRAFGIYGSRGS